MKRIYLHLLLAAATIAFTATGWAADTEKVLFNVQGGAYGNAPYSMVRDTNGNIYGAFFEGGSSCPYTTGCGVVYKLSPNTNGQLSESIIHTFTGGDDGSGPISLLMDPNGNLFVATLDGGSKKCVDGCGAIIELSPLPGGGWNTTVLYDFQGDFDGQHPMISAMDTQGNIYGAFTKAGQVFELTRNSNRTWTKKFLYLFNTVSAYVPTPWAVDVNGNVYGTAWYGGDSNCLEYEDECGAIFELSPNSDGTWSATLLHSFTGTDGARPVMIIPDANGNFFGLTQTGGTGTSCTLSYSTGCGTLFELSPSSTDYTLSVLHDFNKTLDGYEPYYLVMDQNENLYVAADVGGVGGKGVVLEFTLGSDGIWEYSTLHSFAGGLGGSYPDALQLDSSGNVYGIAGAGGTKNYGVIFELSPTAAVK
jgi:hypothetical protein